jgi:predicted RNA binding protein YcfA (HicA-like mRNA interferase family)
MPPSLPIISGAEAIRALQRLGFVVVCQRGSHIVLRRGSQGCVVPNHREMKIGTLSGVLKQAGVSVDEFINAINT